MNTIKYEVFHTADELVYYVDTKRISGVDFHKYCVDAFKYATSKKYRVFKLIVENHTVNFEIFLCKN